MSNSPAPVGPRRVARAVKLLIATLALTLLATACSSGDVAGTTTAAPSTSAPPSTTTVAPAVAVPELSRLDSGSHLGVTWFSPPSPGSETDAVARREESFAAGSDIDRVLLDWVEIETGPGIYDFSEMREQLAAMTEAGVQPMVTISFVGDPDAQFIPDHLGGWTDTKSVADAYLAMLDVAVPIMAEHDVWALSIANEPEVPVDDGLLSGAQLVEFFELVVEGTRALDPDLPVSATLGADSVFREAPYVADAIEALDLAVFNHYCRRGNLTVVDADEIEERFDALLSAAGDRPIVFQELGCPASEAMGSSLDFQAEWFATAFDRIIAEPQFRAAYVFELVDWSPELVDLLYGEFVDAFPELGGRLLDWLATSGLLTYDGATPRPAWHVFIAAIEQVAA